MAYNKIITKHDYDFKMTKKFNRHYIMTHSIFMYLIFALGLFSLYSLLTGEKPKNDEMFAYYLQWSIAIIGILFVPIYLLLNVHLITKKDAKSKVGFFEVNEFTKERIVKRDNISEDKFNLRDSSSIEYDKEKFDYVISSDDYDIKEVLGLNKKRVLYPGSFDPITLGHMNIIEQASLLFDEVIVAVLTNSSKKNSFFTPEERVRIIKEIYKQVDNIKVVQGEGATVDLAMLYNCKAIVRGLRGLSDYDYEVQLSQINKDISNGEVNTICFFADQKYQFISSSVVKEVYNLGKDITPYVHPYVKQKMYERGE